MKNVAISNYEMAKRAAIVVAGLGVLYFVGQNVPVDHAVMSSSASVSSVQQVLPQATLLIPHDMRGIYYTGDDCDTTATHEVHIGMPEAEILCQTGRPSTVNKSVSKYGTRTQYVFEGLSGDRWYLYTTNGVISSWQESWTK